MKSKGNKLKILAYSVQHASTFPRLHNVPEDGEKNKNDSYCADA